MRPRPRLPGIVPRDRIRAIAVRRPASATIARFLTLADMAGLVSRALDRLGVAGAIAAHTLAPLRPGQRMAGPAITVRNVPDRFVPHRKWTDGLASRLGEREAYFLARRGDVIVIDGGGRIAASNMGAQSALVAQSRGCAGSIVDGPVTGTAEIVRSGYPVWARGATTITGHHRVETIEINGIVACAGVQVHPGDLVVADDSGVAIVPRELVDDVWRICERQAAIASEMRRGSKNATAAAQKKFTREVVRA
jgi:4-hydroxy-4-methyl-2-oxoglutarate aldolase